jgi:pSer/pThr/pTyr-binding forkhead associated (FHA) protein
VPDTILIALKLIFVAFIYLFVWQIARSIAAHLGTGQPRIRTKPGAGLVVVRSETQSGLNLEVRYSLVIGRSEEADVQIEDAYASEFHVRLVNETGNLALHDLGSTNGTYVNGRRVTVPLNLNKGDAVQIGNTVFEVT